MAKVAKDYERLIYTNANGGSIEFSIMSDFYVNVAKDVTGISDVKNTIYSTSSMGQHGETFISQKINSRDIDITGYINRSDKDNMLTLRRAMQKILNPELDATLTYIYGNFRKVIDVKVDNAPVFKYSKVLEQFTVQFTCPSPFWRDETETRKDIASWVGSFSFALEIPKDEGIQFGYRQPSVIVDVYNEGDVKTGMRVAFRATGTVEKPLLLNINTGEYIQVNATLSAGDVVTVNTEYGNKGATLASGGSTSDYFRYIDVDSTFMQLEIGDNVFRYNAAAGLDALEVTIYYSPKYLGV